MTDNKSRAESIAEALEIIEKITGIEYSDEEFNRIVKKAEAGEYLSEIFNDDGLTLIRGIDRAFQGKELALRFEFIPLKYCIPHVDNESLLMFLGAYLAYMEHREPTSAESYVLSIYDAINEAGYRIIPIMYSGYDITEWTEILEDAIHLYYTSIIRDIASLLYTIMMSRCMYVSEEGKGAICVLKHLSDVRRSVPDIRDLIQVSLIINTDQISERNMNLIQEIKYLSKAYLDVVEDFSCMRGETIVRLVDNYVPLSALKYRKTIPNLFILRRNENIFSILDSCNTIREAYVKLFGSDPDMLREVMSAHAEAFDALSRLIDETPLWGCIIEGITNCVSYGGDWSDTGDVGDVSKQMGDLLLSVLKTAISIMIESSDIDTAADGVVRHFSMVSAVSEGIREMFKDEYNKRKMLEIMLRVIDEACGDGTSVISSWISRAETKIHRNLDVLLAHPKAIAVVAMDVMSAEEAYAQVVTRGDIRL
jgi:hypothetical protein